MSLLSIRMFGKLCVRLDEQAVDGLHAGKLQDLFCYLLLYRAAPHAREKLATLLWCDSSTAQAKKYLRQALWQMQEALDARLPAAASRPLLADHDWVQFNPAAEIWLDVAAFEQAVAQTQGAAGSALNAEQAALLQQAVALYQGDLLEDCYHDWCLCERERLQSDYLALLDKLMSWCEGQRQYECGLHYGQMVMRYERARECTHRRLMRLHYLAGDRTAALRQYARCVESLQEELAIKPGRRTVELYERMRADEFERREPPQTGSGTTSKPVATDSASASSAQVTSATLLPEVLDHLRQVRETLAKIQQQAQQDIEAVDLVLRDRS